MKECVSVIVPVYNGEKWLNRCVDSVLHQTYDNIEIILVDDGSVDNSALICDDYAKKYTNIKTVHQANAGAGNARNRGLDCAMGEYICFVDSDDWIEAHYIEGLIKGITDTDVSICGYAISDECGVNDLHKMIVCDRLDVLRRMLMPGYPNAGACYGYLWNKMFKASIIKKYNIRFNNNYVMWEDMLFCCRYISYIKDGRFSAEKLYHYNIDNTESLSHRVNASMMDSWICAAKEIEAVLKAIGYYEDVHYDEVLADLYMKTLIAYAKEKKLKGLSKDIGIFLNNNSNLLRKKYRVYLFVYNRTPLLLQDISMLLSV